MSEVKGADKFLYVTAEDGALYSIDPQTGRQRWKVPGGGGAFISPTNYATGRVFYAYMNSVSSKLRAVDGQSGSVVWESSSHNITTATPMHGLGSVFLGVPQIGNVYYRYDAAAGTSNWNVSNSSQQAGSYTSGVLDTDVEGGSPAKIYVSTETSEVRAISAAAGSTIWQTPLPHFGVVHGLALTQERSRNVLVASQLNRLYALDPADGSILWTYAHPANAVDASNRRTPRPAIYGALVFHIAGGNRLVAVSLADGSEQWGVDLDGSTFSSPCVGGRTVYIGTSAGSLYAFSP